MTYYDELALAIRLPATLCPDWCGKEDGRMCLTHNKILTAIRAATDSAEKSWVRMLAEMRDQKDAEIRAIRAQYKEADDGASLASSTSTTVRK